MSVPVDKATAPASATQSTASASGLSQPVAASTVWKRRLFWTVFAVVLLFVPFVLDKFWLSVAVFGMIASIGAIGLNVLAGYTGLASLGHAFFLGVGAYTCVYFGGKLGWSFLLWLPLAGLMAGLIGLLVGWLTLRFRGFYLTVMTIGLAFIGGHIFLNWKEISGGVQGSKVPAPALGDFNWAKASSVGPLDLTRDQKYYFLVLPVLVLVALFVSNVVRTRMGRAFQAIRDREVAAELMGIDVARTKITAFVFSSVLAGLGGALYASYLSYVQPDQWNLTYSIEFIAMIIIGGIASVPGAIIGALLLSAMPQVISSLSDNIPFVQKGAGTGGITVNDLNEIIYALFLGVFLIFEPTGIYGIYRRIKARVLRSSFGKYFR